MPYRVLVCLYTVPLVRGGLRSRCRIGVQLELTAPVPVRVSVLLVALFPVELSLALCLLALGCNSLLGWPWLLLRIAKTPVNVVFTRASLVAGGQCYPVAYNSIVAH